LIKDFWLHLVFLLDDDWRANFHPFLLESSFLPPDVASLSSLVAVEVLAGVASTSMISGEVFLEPVVSDFA